MRNALLRKEDSTINYKFTNIVLMVFGYPLHLPGMIGHAMSGWISHRITL